MDNYAIVTIPPGAEGFPRGNHHWSMDTLNSRFLKRWEFTLWTLGGHSWKLLEWGWYG